MAEYRSYFWKKVPFLKLLLAFMAGILLQWSFPAGQQCWWWLLGTGIIALAGLSFITLFNRYRFAFINGLIISLLFLGLGALLAWKKDPRNQKNWFGNFYTEAYGLMVAIEEPPVEKTRSVKAIAAVNYLLRDGELLKVKGRVILYFSKDAAADLAYGAQLIFKRPLQEIKNAANPGGFDYKRYALFQGITHQSYLKAGDFEILNQPNENNFRKFLYRSKEKILALLRDNIKGQKELGLAEALLIGYKHDLDQALVQSYTNTGVVHIIAISGLHLGLIYWLMALLLRPLQKRKKTKWIRAVLIVTVLWTFSLMAGAQPSILRSALMFTCIVLGESLSKKGSIYNTMAVSAFVLLCINPYWLWDVGFQLSYAAVLSIIIFMQPIYNLFYIKNKLLDLVWKLNAVTLAAHIFCLLLSLTAYLSSFRGERYLKFFCPLSFIGVGG